MRCLDFLKQQPSFCFEGECLGFETVSTFITSSELSKSISEICVANHVDDLASLVQQPLLLAFNNGYLKDNWLHLHGLMFDEITISQSCNGRVKGSQFVDLPESTMMCKSR